MSQFKLVVVGDKHTGKTCTLMSYFNPYLLPGVDDVPLVFNQACHLSSNGKPYTLVLWDISCSQVRIPDLVDLPYIFKVDKRCFSVLLAWLGTASISVLSNDRRVFRVF